VLDHIAIVESIDVPKADEVSMLLLRGIDASQQDSQGQMFPSF